MHHSHSQGSSPTPTLVNEDMSTEGRAPSQRPLSAAAPPSGGGGRGDRELDKPLQRGSTSSESSGTVPIKSWSQSEKDTEAVRVQVYEGEGTVESPFVVDWAEFDPENPLEWAGLKKWYITAVVATGTLVVAFGSSVFAGGIPQMMKYFDKDSTILTLGLTFYVLGFALGPLLWAPFSELYGRRAVLLPTYSLFTVFHIGCALAHNIETLLVMRFFAGFFGSSPLTNSGGVVSDIFDSKTRALALAWFSLSPFAGPVLGPIVGGYMGMTVSWRLIFYVLTGFAGILLALSFTIPETYAPVLLRRRALRLSRETGHCYLSHHDLKLDANETVIHKLKVNVSRPFIFLIFEPIVLTMAIYAAVVYAVLYMMFPSFPIIFEHQRGWSLGASGLPFIGIGVGMLLGIMLNVFVVNPKYIRDLDAAGGHLPPEARLPTCCLGGISLPIGLFWFAWTAQPSVHWIVPCLATVPFGFGMVVIFLSMMSYLVDSYLWLCASALAANAVIRSLCGATFPLFVKSMFDKLGLNWALTLVAFLSLLLTPIPFVFYRYGARIRAYSKYAPSHRPPPNSLPAAIVADIAEEDLQQRQMREVDRRSVAGENTSSGVIADK